MEPGVLVSCRTLPEELISSAEIGTAELGVGLLPISESLGMQAHSRGR